MTSNLTGGYDVCIEVSDKVIRSQVLTAVGPFLQQLKGELVLAIAQAAGEVPLSGRLHLFLTSVDVRAIAQTDAHIQLSIGFQRSAVHLDAPTSSSAGELSGAFMFTYPVTLGAVDTGTTIPLVVDPGAPEHASMVLTKGEDELARLCATAGVDVAEARGALTHTLLGILSPLGSFSVKTPLRLVADDQDGDLDAMKFAALELGTRTGPVGGALCIFGTVLRAHIGRGNRILKNKLALAPGRTTEVTIDPQAFHDLQFCPNVFHGFLPDWLVHTLPGDFLSSLPADALDFIPNEDRRKTLHDYIDDDDKHASFWTNLLGAKPLPSLLAKLGPVIATKLPADPLAVLGDTRAAAARMLPPTCGTGKFPIEDANITRLSDTLENGFIRLEGRVVPDKTGVEGFATFVADVRLEVVEKTQADGSTVPKLELKLDAGALQIDNHVSLADWAWAVGIIFGGAVGAGIASAIGGYIQRTAYNKTRNAVFKAVDSFNSPSLSATLGTLVDVTISPQGISIGFSKDLPATAAVPVTFPSLYVSQSAQRTLGPLGPDQTQTFDNPCLHGTYHYRQQDVLMTVTFTAQATQLDAPVRYTWMVGYGEVSGSGVLTGDDGTRLRYAVSADGSVLTLSNDGGQAAFRVDVRCRAVDPDGLRAEAPPILALFEGTQRIWEDRYGQDLRQCIRGAMKSIGRGPTMQPPGSQPGIGPVSLGQLVDGGAFDPVALRQLATLSQAAGPIGRGLVQVAQAVRTFGRARHG